MSGVPGKNKIERGFRIIFDDNGSSARDLSGDLVPGTVTSPGGLVWDEVDMTGANQTVKNSLAGQADSDISAQFYMNDTATTGAFTVLNGMGGKVGTLTLQYGSNGAAPSTGDPEWEGEYVLLDTSINNSNGKFVINAHFRPSGDVAPAWGTVS